MKIKVEIVESLTETEIVIRCHEMNDEVQKIMDGLKEKKVDFIIAKKEEMQHILRLKDILYFRSEASSVMARTIDGIFEIKEKLYELEDALPKNSFIRLSKSVIANLNMLTKFEAYFNGTLCVHFKNGEKEYVSRHYVGKIKDVLQLKRRKY